MVIIDGRYVKPKILKANSINNKYLHKKEGLSPFMSKYIGKGGMKMDKIKVIDNKGNKKDYNSLKDLDLVGAIEVSSVYNGGYWVELGFPEQQRVNIDNVNNLIVEFENTEDNLIIVCKDIKEKIIRDKEINDLIKNTDN